MKLNDHLFHFSKKLLYVIVVFIILIALLYFFWQKNKFSLVSSKLETEVITQTDSLYTIKYDSLYFDEVRGEAFIKNVRITPDTFRIRNTPLARLPYLVLDVAIKTIIIKGVKTDKAIQGTALVGDSIIIDAPGITVYFLKPIKKETKIDAEAKEVYRQILGRLDMIQVGHVSIKNAEVHAINFNSHYKQFDINKITVDLHDVRIDSLHYEDTSRILFCKDASFHIDQFYSYNDNRNELSVKDINFFGMQRKLSFANLLLNRFDGDAHDGVKLMEANNFFISGINTYEIVKNKNIFIDSILCRHISFYRPPSVSGSPKPIAKVRITPQDTTGFRRAYSLQLNNIYFPDIDVLEINEPEAKSNFKLGKFVLKVRGIKAGEILDMQLHPIANTKEVDLFCNNVFYNSPDNVYHYDLQNIRINSLYKQATLASFRLYSSLSEAAFAQKARLQKDRYDLSFSGISLNDINLDHILDKQLIADNLVINNSNIKIYRDVTYPLAPGSKVGNYPSQVLMKTPIPVDIKNVQLKNTYLEYKEKSAVSGKAGTIKFEQGAININNITNIASSIKLNNEMKANYKTTVLGTIPLNTNFTFYLNANDGKFAANGTIGSCDAKTLNQISMPMAMIRIDTGHIDDAKFDFTGNDNGLKGDFVMRYKDFKVAMMKKGEENTQDKKRSFLSVLANTFIKNENPHNGKLRTFTVEYDREKSKSFFNLVWKGVFTGMKSTLGMPGGKIKDEK